MKTSTGNSSRSRRDLVLEALSRSHNIRKRGMALTTKTMFAIFLVLFVFFILFMILGQRSAKLQEKQYFDHRSMHNRFFLMLLSNSNCFSVGDKLNSHFSDVHAVFEEKKLSASDMLNTDPWCIENYQFLYSLKVTDRMTMSSWQIGLDDTDPFWDRIFADSKVSTILPCVVRYEKGVTHGCTVTLSTYSGSLPRMYGLIKESCVSKRSYAYSLDSDFPIRYESSTRRFWLGDHSFFAYFSCPVDDFSLPEGENLLYVANERGNVRVAS